jgi:hypothetical protein
MIFCIARSFVSKKFTMLYALLTCRAKYANAQRGQRTSKPHYNPQMSFDFRHFRPRGMQTSHTHNIMGSTEPFCMLGSTRVNTLSPSGINGWP